MRDETSGMAPYENLRSLTRLHRVPATPEFDQAAELILMRAREYGLQDAHSEQFPIDGKIHYGLMRSHLAWRVEAASLWELAPEHTLLGDWSTEPIRLADYSHSADADTPLVDVGQGTSEADYNGKDVPGKIVLADGVLATVQRMAVTQHGAVGIVSDMPNQATAWSGLDTSIVRWGHLDARLPSGFAFMVSRATATALRAQLTSGQPVMLSAHVKAEVMNGHWTVVTATVPGTDPHAGEVVYSCHLDHQRPGANDNASGCVTILESARVLNHLIGSGKLPRPARTLRFIWGPEVEGTMAFLSEHPDIRRSLRADVHMDMVGGDPYKNKSILHVTETPWSLPSFVTDVGELFAETIRAGATAYAGMAPMPRPQCSKIVTELSVRGTSFWLTGHRMPRAVITTTMIRRRSRYPRSTCGTGRIFIFTPITTRWSRSTLPNYGGSLCWVRLRDTRTRRSMPMGPVPCFRSSRPARNGGWRRASSERRVSCKTANCSHGRPGTTPAI
jgi:aminopeptidase YwaD